MATKKNPLSALLRTDDRQQIQELQRDHVLRSAARQAGTYGVGVQKPLPISQTNLGRLSNSLGTVSGILAQFSAYQAEREQVELKGQGLQHTLNMQELQSLEADLSTKAALIQKGTAHEVVKKQAIQLEQAREDAANAEFDLMVRDSNTEQRVDMFRRAQEQVRITRERAELARLGQPLDPYSPEFKDRSLRIIGSLRGADFADYLEAETQKALVELRKNDNGASLTREEAMDLAEEIRERYMDLKELSLDDEIGRGFMNATERLRAAREPELANKLLKQSESINTENLIGAVKQWAESEPDWDNLERQEWYAQMTGMDKYRFLGAFMGTQGNPALGTVGTPGVKGLMTQTHKGALQFQQLFNRVGEKYQLEGKPFNEYSGFDALAASVEEAVEKTAVKEANKNDNLLKIAQNAAAPQLFTLASQKDATDRAAMTVNFIQPGDDVNPEPLRERIKGVFGIDTKGLPDDQVVPFAGWLLSEVHGIGDTHDKQTAALLTKALGKNYVRYDEQKGLALAFLNSKRKADMIKGTKNVSHFYNEFLNGYGKENEYDGLSQDGGGYMVNEFDKMSGGAVTQYTEDLNNLKSEVEAILPENATDEQFAEAYRVKHKELQEKFEETIARVVVDHVGERTKLQEILSKDIDDVSKALMDISKEEGFEGLEGAVFIDPTKYSETLRLNPTMSHLEAMEVTREQGHILLTPSAETLKNSWSRNPEEAKNLIERRGATLKKLEELSKSFNSGPLFHDIREIATELADSGIGFFDDDDVEEYKGLMTKASETEQGRIKYGIDTKEVASISAAVVAKPNAATVLRDGDDFVRRFYVSKGPGRSKGFQPFFYVKEDKHGKLIVDPDWTHKVKMNVTLPPGFLQKNQPPITGIPFGKYPPITTEVENLRKKIGWSQEELENTVKAYGFYFPSAFFRSQFNNSYYHNLRGAKAK